MRRALKTAGVPDAGALAAITAAWPEAVGEAIAQAAWPQRLARDGTLHLTAVSATWAFELGRLESEIRDRLAETLGSVTPPALRFAPGPVPSPGPTERAPSPLPPATGEEVRRAATLTAGIDDDDLREAIHRAAVASLVAARSGRGL